MKPIRLISGFVTVGVWTLGSRLLGFVRDILIASYLGAGPVAEAFLIAFSLPNMFRRFFAEGAFNMAFVPMFAKKLEAEEDAQGFARDAFSAMFWVLAGFSAVAILAMPVLVMAMASGFAADERFALAVSYGRVAFPYILLISLAALISGVLNSLGRFGSAAAAPLLLNIIFIISLLAGDRFAAVDVTADRQLVIGQWLIWAVPVAGLSQLVFVWAGARRAGYRFGIRVPKLTPELKRLAVIAAPAAMAGGIVQINLLVGRQVASFFDGAVAWLNYADRLYQLPLGVVGAAIGVVLLPDLSRRLRGGDVAGGRDAFNRAAELSLTLTIPAAVALWAIARPLIDTLYLRGAFTSQDAAATATVLAIYALGLPAFVLQKALQPLFFARENTKSPFRYAIVDLFANAGLAITLMSVVGYIAAPIATVTAGWIMVWMLWRGSRKMGEAAMLDRRLLNRMPRVIAAAALMGGVLRATAYALPSFASMGSLRYPAMAGLVVLGMVIYFGAGQLLGAFRLGEFRRAVSRRKNGS